MFDPNAAVQSLGMLYPTEALTTDNMYAVYFAFQRRVESFIPLCNTLAALEIMDPMKFGGSQIRGPYWNPNAVDLYGWHQDCAGRAHFIAMWANENPTQIRINNTEKILTPQPYEIVVINNHQCMHRCPPGTYEDPSVSTRVICLARINAPAVRSYVDASAARDANTENAFRKVAPDFTHWL